MGRYSVKRYKVKRRTKDLDLIYNELGSKETIIKLKDQPLDEYKTGMGQFYCIHCAKYFEDDHSIQAHYKAKIHKRRVKALKERPYTNIEANAAAGNDVAKFLASVEKHKARALFEEQNKEELEKLVTTNHPKIIGEEGVVAEEEHLEVNEVVMET